MKNQDNESHKLKTVIVGAGSIGAASSSNASNRGISHAEVITSHAEFSLTGLIDKNEDKASRMAKLWSCKTLKNLCDTDSDVIVLATPKEYHEEWFNRALNSHPNLIVLEKPISISLEGAKRIVNVSKESKTKVCVNYSRRYLNAYQVLAQQIAANELGQFISGHGYYSKGIVHNGTHMLDLMNLLMGPYKSFVKTNSLIDYDETDPTISAVLNYGEGHFNLIGSDCNKYTLFEMVLNFDKGRIVTEDLGRKVYFQRAVDSEKYKGYIVLNGKEDFFNEEESPIEKLYDHIYDVIINEHLVICGLQDAYRALEQATEMIEAKL